MFPCLLQSSQMVSVTLMESTRHRLEGLLFVKTRGAFYPFYYCKLFSDNKHKENLGYEKMCPW